MEVGVEGGEELGRQKFAFIGESHSQQIPEFLPQMSKERHSSCWRWLDMLRYVTRLLEHVLDMWVAACTGNVPETMSTSSFPSEGTNSPASPQSSLLSNILLQACFVCKEYISTKGKALWWSWQCGPLKKRIQRGRRGSRLVSQADSYFVSISITVSPEDWNWDPREQLGSGERKQVGSSMVRFVDYGC